MMLVKVGLWVGWWFCILILRCFPGWFSENVCSYCNDWGAGPEAGRLQLQNELFLGRPSPVVMKRDGFDVSGSVGTILIVRQAVL